MATVPRRIMLRETAGVTRRVNAGIARGGSVSSQARSDVRQRQPTLRGGALVKPRSHRCRGAPQTSGFTTSYSPETMIGSLSVAMGPPLVRQLMQSQQIRVPIPNTIPTPLHCPHQGWVDRCHRFLGVAVGCQTSRDFVP
jgi:hypothetical protein